MIDYTSKCPLRCSLRTIRDVLMTDKGKPVEIRGRKAIGSQGRPLRGNKRDDPDSQLPVNTGGTCLGL